MNYINEPRRMPRVLLAKPYSICKYKMEVMYIDSLSEVRAGVKPLPNPYLDFPPPPHQILPLARVQSALV
jgi:hypothetical protein